MHVWHNKVGCCLAVIAGLSSAAVAAPDADSYIHRGLIAQWDGIDNLGTGTHVADTNVWVDRTGNSTAFTASYLSFTDGMCAYLQGTRITSTCSKLPSTYAESTIEVHAFSPRYTGGHGAVDSLLSTGQGGTLFWQTEKSNYGCIYVANATTVYYAGATGKPFTFVPAQNLDITTPGGTWSMTAGNYACSVYANGVKGTTSDWSWWKASYSPSQEVCFGSAYEGADYKAYSIRVYNRQLSPNEIAINAAIDRIRFQGADPALEIAKLEPFGFRWNAEQARVEVRLRAQCNRGALSVAEAWYPMEETVSVDYAPDGDGSFAWRGLPQGAVVSDDRLRVTFVLSAGADLSVEAHLVPAKTAYVTRGLIAQWDGIDNLGTGTHVADTNVWVDLCGNSTPFEGDALAFGLGAVTFPDSTAFTATCSKLREGVYGPVTMECCGFATRFVPSGGAQTFFALGAGCYMFFQGKANNENAANNLGVMYVKDGATGVTTLDGGDMVNNTFSVPSHAITDHNTWTLSQADNSRKIYLRGVKGDFAAAAKDWWPGTATYSQAVTLGCANGGIDFCYHAVRVYDRQLSDAEVAYNAAIDRIRFEGASYSNEVAKMETYGYRWNEERQKIEILITATGTRGEFKQDAIWCGIGEPVTFEFKTTQKGYRKVVWSGFDEKNLVARQRGIATFVFTEPHTVTATAELGGDGLMLFLK